MNTKMNLIVVICLILLLVLVGCTPTADDPEPTQVPTAESQPLQAIAPTAETEVPPTTEPTPALDPAAALVLDMVARVNAEDFAGAAELVADDMMAYFIGMPPVGMEIYWGKEQFRTFLEECCTGQHFVWEVTPERVEDGVVYAEAKTWMDFTRELGVAPNSFHELFIVKDGKITLYASTMTETALTNFKPALREVMPDLFEVTLPSGETPAQELTITIANGTCALDGPMTLATGPITVNVNVEDQNWEEYAVTFFTLMEPDKDLLDLMASTHRAGPPSWARMFFIKELGPNESQSYTSTFEWGEGLIYLVCWGSPPAIPIGNAGPFVVQE